MTDESAAYLTEEKFRAAMQALWDEPLKAHQHVVGPHAEGWTRCADCFQPINVTTDSQGRKRLGTPAESAPEAGS